MASRKHATEAMSAWRRGMSPFTSTRVPPVVVTPTLSAPPMRVVFARSFSKSKYSLPMYVPLVRKYSATSETQNTAQFSVPESQ